MGMLDGVRALIVESSAINRGILHAQMSNWGMSNRVAATPEQALELLAQAAARGAPYDIAIIDLGAAGHGRARARARDQGATPGSPRCGWSC